MKSKLTEKQKRVLQFITRKIWRERNPPTIREIAQNFKLSSTGTVRDYLKALQKKGYIRLAKKRSRAIELINERLMQFPIVAQVYAGSPILTYEDIEGYLNLEQLIFQQEDGVFGVRVEGDSMVGAGIMPRPYCLPRLLPFQDTHKELFGKQDIFSLALICLQYRKLVQKVMSAKAISIRYITNYSQRILSIASKISKIWTQKFTQTSSTLCLQLGV